ncbi:MAG TPA: preprotein translocase subunit SecE [Phototrophicaceae bacterium]|jgi:preprotein translocase SecE subunit|nr:preprotein translocase subunit SecE [Phototrophicaceae bacterium]
MTMSADVNEKRGRRRRRTEEEIAAEAAEAEEMDDDSEDEGEVGEGAITAPKGRPTLGRRNRQQVEEPEGNVVTGTFGWIRDNLQDVRSELEKVSWPTRQEVIRLMQIVIAVTVSASIVLGIIALGFTELFAAGLQNPLIFVIFFIIIGGAGFFVYRNMQNQSASDDYNYPTRQ